MTFRSLIAAAMLVAPLPAGAQTVTPTNPPATVSPPSSSFASSPRPIRIDGPVIVNLGVRRR
ncbi:MAG: hypothetical protein AB7P02_07660 [Alphaproteobacteria bacterium]